MDKTNKIMCGLLVFAGMMFLVHIPYYNPEEEVLKHLKDIIKSLWYCLVKLCQIEREIWSMMQK